MRARADGLPDSAEARAAASTSGQLGTLRPASYFRFGLQAGARSTALGRRRAPAIVRLSDSLGMVRDVFVVTALVTPGSSRTSSSGITCEWTLRSSRL